MSDDSISDKLNYLPYLVIFTYKIYSCTTSRNLPTMSDDCTLMHSSDIAWQVSRCSTRRHVICKKWQGKGDNSVCHLYSHRTLLGKSLDVVLQFLLILRRTTSRDLPSNVWWLYQWQTKLSPLPCDFLHIKFLLVLHLESCQAMSDDCISDKLNYLPYLVTLRETIQFVTDTVIRYCLASF
jgi:hypothetical protein